MELQNKLDNTYYKEQFIRDHRIPTAIAIPSTKSKLRDRLPATSQQDFTRISNHLLEIPSTAGSNYTCIVGANEDHVHY